jgi:hypothetical protein
MRCTVETPLTMEICFQETVNAKATAISWFEAHLESAS